MRVRENSGDKGYELKNKKGWKSIKWPEPPDPVFRLGESNLDSKGGVFQAKLK